MLQVKKPGLCYLFGFVNLLLYCLIVIFIGHCLGIFHHCIYLAGNISYSLSDRERSLQKIDTFRLLTS